VVLHIVELRKTGFKWLEAGNIQTGVGHGHPMTDLSALILD